MTPQRLTRERASEVHRAAHGKFPLDVSDLDLTSVDPIFTEYTVTEDDAKAVGPVPSGPAAQSKSKSLPYRSIAECVAERFHCDLDFLEELNPGKTKGLKVGDAVTVPNVEPFNLAAVKVSGGKEASTDGTSGSSPDSTAKRRKGKDKAESEEGSQTTLHISTKSNMLEVREGNKIKAAFPVTVGSRQTESPMGQWKVQRITRMPTFRYDPEMLKHGERSSNFHLLPPGPNNPVGVMWIALNKKGIGLHGTHSPDTIGRSASHGCIRLANWDVVKLASMVKPGVPVTIE